MLSKLDVGMFSSTSRRMLCRVPDGDVYARYYSIKNMITAYILHRTIQNTHDTCRLFCYLFFFSVLYLFLIFMVWLVFVAGTLAFHLLYLDQLRLLGLLRLTVCDCDCDNSICISLG